MEILSQLRSATRELHTKLDHSPSLLRLLSPQLTSGEYADILQRLHGVVAPLEEALFADHERLAHWRIKPWQQRRCFNLRRDLSALGVNACELSLARARVPISCNASHSEWLGCFYVAEGSRLGGQLIAGRVAKTLGLSSEGLTFFSSDGADVASIWRDAQNVIVTQSQMLSQSDLAAMLTSARSTFQMFIDWLT